MSVAVIMISCAGNGADRTVRSIRLKSPIRDDVFTQGEKIPVVVTSRGKSRSIDSIEFREDGVVIKTLTSKPWVYGWIPKGTRLGAHQLKIWAYHSNGSVGKVTSRVCLKSSQAPDKYKCKVIKSYHHDPSAYTQGLFYYDGFLWEGTGQRGESSIRKVKIENGKILKSIAIEDKYFGEGITRYKDKLLQLTYKSGRAFVYSMNDLKRQDTFYPSTITGEGWGITTMGKELVISDGSNQLTVLDADTHSHKRIIEVYDHRGAVKNLNELEYIHGMIYANVWLTNRIVVIDPATGRVNRDIELYGLLTPDEQRRLDPNDDVLNGIAWDSEHNHLYVTGKHWPKLFKISLVKE